MADSRQREEVKRAGFRSSTKSSDYPPFPSLMDGRLWSKRMGHKALGKKPLTTVYGHWTSKTFPLRSEDGASSAGKRGPAKGIFIFREKDHARILLELSDNREPSVPLPARLLSSSKTVWSDVTCLMGILGKVHNGWPVYRWRTSFFWNRFVMNTWLRDQDFYILRISWQRRQDWIIKDM